MEYQFNRGTELPAIENEHNVSFQNQPPVDENTEEVAQEQSPAPCEEIWTRKKPNDRDNEATALLLAERQKLSSRFDDKKTRKSKLWNDIAQKLIEKGFFLGDKGGEKCRQKFANLQKAYLQYIKLQNTTGSERNDDIPLFMDEIHSILGGKHKINPLNLEDSMESTQQSISDNAGILNKDIEQSNNSDSKTEDEDSRPSTSKQHLQQQKNEDDKANNTPTTSKDFSERFKISSRKVTPSRHDELIKEIEKDRAGRSQEFDFIKSHLTKSEKQVDRLIDVIERALLSNKRKREDSDSDD